MQAVGDRACLQIVRALVMAPTSLVVGVIALPRRHCTRTHHMPFLRRAGVISVRATGTRRITRLRGEAPDALWSGLPRCPRLRPRGYGT